jgi:predicted nucleic acid-binding protein
VSFLLDTCALSELTRPVPHAAFLAWFHAQSPESLFISALTVGEIEKGIFLASPGRKRAALETWLGRMRSVFSGRILLIDDDVATAWGRLAATAEQNGQPLAIIDGLIAATALIHAFSVVTRNVGDFRSSGVSILNPWMD